jgi:serine/threonine protein kinase
MARIIWLTDHPAPVNAGEERALAHLAKTLPDSVALIPNLTIPYTHPQNPEEYDIIAITPDAVFVVEVKDLAADIEIDEQHMFVNGNPRSNPYLTTRIKAQKLKTKLVQQLPWFYQGGWVEHLVVLARQPASLSVCDAMKMRVVLLDEATTLIAPGTPLIREKHHGQLHNKDNEVISCITAGASERKSPTVFGDYEATSPIFKTNQLEAWRARHHLTGAEVVLEVHRLDPAMPHAQIPQWKQKCLQIEEVSRQIGSSADIDAPRYSTELTDGTLVVVWPEREPNTLQHFLNQMTEESAQFDTTKAGKVLEGFASVLAHLHSHGWTLGQVAPHNLVVRPSGRGAIILGDPIPKVDSDTSSDLRWLGNLVITVNESLNDKRLKELAEGLQRTKRDEQVSAVMALAVLSGANIDRQVVEHDLLARFTNKSTIATHQFGTTTLATDTHLKRDVILKQESGRPGLSWALREYRTLSLPSLSHNPHIVSTTSGDSLGDTSYVALELIEAPTLASMIDAGVLRDPEKALAVAAQILEILSSLHPDITAIMSLLSSHEGPLDEEVQVKLGALRDAGLAHNHLDASNIFVHPTRGVVLSDFVRAARFGEVIPTRSVFAWPKGAPVTTSDPLADLYAVGSLIIRMLTTSTSGLVTNTETPSELGAHLIDVALRAVSDDPQQRFTSAAAFLDVLLSNITVGKLPTVSEDVLSLQRKIEQLIKENKFDEALKLCPPEWTITREKIQEKQSLFNIEGSEILKIGDVSLRHIGEIEIPAGSTSENKAHEGGTAIAYHSIDADGGIIEILVCTADTEDGTKQWTATGNGFGYPDRLSHAVRSLRITIKNVDGIDHMELMQAQLKQEPKHPNQSTKKMVNSAQLSAPLRGQDAGALFTSFGAEGFGTKAELWAETGGHKNYLAVTFRDDATHVPAVAHFISRIIPLYAGVIES